MPPVGDTVWLAHTAEWGVAGWGWGRIGGRHLGSACSPSRYSKGYTALRGRPGSARPSGGDTGSTVSSLLHRTDVFLGSGDLGRKGAQLWSVRALRMGGHPRQLAAPSTRALCRVGVTPASWLCPQPGLSAGWVSPRPVGCGFPASSQRTEQPPCSHTGSGLCEVNPQPAWHPCLGPGLSPRGTYRAPTEGTLRLAAQAGVQGQ